MAEFQVLVRRLDDVLAHPNADRLELSQLGGYLSVIPKDRYKKGDLVVYIPEGAVMPLWLLDQQGLTGKLAGSGRNRVKAVKLRGILSQGICVGLLRHLGDPTRYALDISDATECEEVIEGQEVGELLGVEKYNPEVPAHMAGDMLNLFGYPLKYDIDNVKAWPNVIHDDEFVVLTEKIHGTFVQIGWDASLEPNPELFGDGRVWITSKGLGGKGLAFKNNAVNESNLYVRALQKLRLPEAVVQNVLDDACEGETPITKIVLMGEIFGDGVQDLKYGLNKEVQFNLFDVFIQRGVCGEFLNADIIPFVAYELGVQSVPVVAAGRWEAFKPGLAERSKGNSAHCDSQIREGLVIKPLRERSDPRLGRVILKSVSEDYLLRKDATELS